MSYKDEKETRSDRVVQGTEPEQKAFEWWPRPAIDGYELVVGGYAAQIKMRGQFSISGPNGGTCGVAMPATAGQARLIVETWLVAQGVRP